MLHFWVLSASRNNVIICRAWQSDWCHRNIMVAPSVIVGTKQSTCYASYLNDRWLYCTNCARLTTSFLPPPVSCDSHHITTNYARKHAIKGILKRETVSLILSLTLLCEDVWWMRKCTEINTVGDVTLRFRHQSVIVSDFDGAWWSLNCTLVKISCKSPRKPDTYHSKIWEVFKFSKKFIVPMWPTSSAKKSISMIWYWHSGSADAA